MSTPDQAKRMLHSIILDKDYFWQNASSDLVLEFPFAPAVGMPARVAGRAEAEPYLDQVAAVLPGLAFDEVEVMPLVEPDAFLLEYHGTCASINNYDQRYITIMRFKSGKLILFREYWNTVEVARALGSDTQSF